jgi:SPP1 gp7 family putative phage head morphogenesis protein
MAAMIQYADALEPWARRIATKMIGELANRDRDAWRALGNEISTQLHTELREAPIGQRVQELINEQVELITSIPRKAAERAQELSLQALEGGTRAREVAQEIARTTQVTQSRAMLIARTETSRAATILLQARAESVGSTAYVWRTSRDSAVRESHRKMEGQVVQWDDPPTLDNLTGHAGALPNCRCYPEPLIADPYAPIVRGRRRH